ncbi:SWEET3 [Symbiodinium sp. CCMP2456]|nr:SWEET3 [Symbiodinium sp. CCMP2456]
MISGSRLHLISTRACPGFPLQSLIMLGDFILETVATCFAFLFMTSPLTQTIDVIATPAKVQNVNPVNLLCFFLNCATQLGYGIFMPVNQVIPCNAYGVAVGFFSIITCWCLARRDEKAERWKLCFLSEQSPQFPIFHLGRCLLHPKQDEP